VSSPLPIGSDVIGLAAQVTARLRPMFAEPVILVDPSDPVIGGPQRIVTTCERFGLARLLRRRAIAEMASKTTRFRAAP
jgi:hypothetical protein